MVSWYIFYRILRKNGRRPKILVAQGSFAKFTVSDYQSVGIVNHLAFAGTRILPTVATIAVIIADKNK